jgi:hypothetical protein
MKHNNSRKILLLASERRPSGEPSADNFGPSVSYLISGKGTSATGTLASASMYERCA